MSLFAPKTDELEEDVENYTPEPEPMRPVRRPVSAHKPKPAPIVTYVPPAIEEVEEDAEVEAEEQPFIEPEPTPEPVIVKKPHTIRKQPRVALKSIVQAVPGNSEEGNILTPNEPAQRAAPARKPKSVPKAAPAAAYVPPVEEEAEEPVIDEDLTVESGPVIAELEPQADSEPLKRMVREEEEIEPEPASFGSSRSRSPFAAFTKSASKPKVQEPAKNSFLSSFMAPKSAEEIAEKRKRLDDMEKERNVSKRVGDLDKTYKEGLTTLRDLLAPASLKFQSSYFELNGKFGRSFFVLAYPRFLSSNWLSFVIQAEGALDLSMFIYPIDSETILKKLKSKVGEIGSQMTINQEKGMVRDPMLETAYSDVEGLRDSLMQGTERYFRFALYFTLYADDLKELDKNSSTLESALGAKLIVTKRALLQTQNGFNSTLPLGIDELDVANNMNTSPLSTAFPFVSSDLTGNDGILYGINRHNNSLILFA